ncbi:hypothetical protein F5H01DRAFT_397270, partial [Linnemannia elongata]
PLATTLLSCLLFLLFPPPAFSISPSSLLNRNEVKDRLHFDYSYPRRFTLQYHHPSESHQRNPVAPASHYASFTSSLYHHTKTIPKYHQHQNHGYNEHRSKNRPSSRRCARSSPDRHQQSSIDLGVCQAGGHSPALCFASRRVPQESICPSPHQFQDWGHWGWSHVGYSSGLFHGVHGVGHPWVFYRWRDWIYHC